MWAQRKNNRLIYNLSGFVRQAYGFYADACYPVRKPPPISAIQALHAGGWNLET